MVYSCAKYQPSVRPAPRPDVHAELIALAQRDVDRARARFCSCSSGRGGRARSGRNGVGRSDRSPRPRDLGAGSLPARRASSSHPSVIGLHEGSGRVERGTSIEVLRVPQRRDELPPTFEVRLAHGGFVSNWPMPYGMVAAITTTATTTAGRHRRAIARRTRPPVRAARRRPRDARSGWSPRRRADPPASVATDEQEEHARQEQRQRHHRGADALTVGSGSHATVRPATRTTPYSAASGALPMAMPLKVATTPVFTKWRIAPQSVARP